MSGKGKSGGKAKGMDNPSSWKRWRYGEEYNLVPPEWREREFTTPDWGPADPLQPGDMKRAMTAHFQELHDEVEETRYNIEQLDGSRDCGPPVECSGMLQDNLCWWKPWRAGEGRNPVPPSWRMWPLSNDAKREVGRYLLVLNDELDLAKCRYAEVQAEDDLRA